MCFPIYPDTKQWIIGDFLYDPETERRQLWKFSEYPEPKKSIFARISIVDLDFLISFFPTSKRWWKLWWFTNGLRKGQEVLDMIENRAIGNNNNNQYPTKTKNVVLSRIILMGLARTFPEYHRIFLEKKKKPDAVQGEN